VVELVLIDIDEKNLAYEILVKILFHLDYRLVDDDIWFYFYNVDWNVRLMMMTFEKPVGMFVSYVDVRSSVVVENVLETLMEIVIPYPVTLVGSKLMLQLFLIRYWHCKLVVDRFSVLHRVLQQQRH
jgi:hypothetical protein